MQLAWDNGSISLFPMLSNTFEMNIRHCIQRHQIWLKLCICFVVMHQL